MSTETITVILPPDPPRATRGTSNRNDRGSAEDRRRRRAWLVLAYASDVPGSVRCYRCGCLLYNPDAYPASDATPMSGEATADNTPRPPLLDRPLTVDRIIPGCKGGTYRRNNIRPACGGCNSETGGALSGSGKQKP